MDIDKLVHNEFARNKGLLSRDEQLRLLGARIAVQRPAHRARNGHQALQPGQPFAYDEDLSKRLPSLSSTLTRDSPQFTPFSPHCP